VLKKLGSAMGDSMEGFPGMGGGQMPPGFPGAVENGDAAAANEEAEEEQEEATVHSAASTGAHVLPCIVYNMCRLHACVSGRGRMLGHAGSATP
jgi:hypothetical protein